MSSAKTILIFCALAFLLGGCLDEIELKDQRFDTQAIIIQGRLILGSPSVVEINEALIDAPEMVNEQPYAAWFFKVQPDDALDKELAALMDATAYAEFAAESEH